MNIEQNVSLLPYNTFGIAARAAYFTHLTHEKDIAPLLREPIFQQQTPLILGGGSNLLFTDNFNGLVIKNELKGIEIMEETGDQVIVKAKAGENWHELALWTIRHQLAGIENLSLIPGLVGASPMQNIGAYGVEIKDVFHSLEAVRLSDGERMVFGLNDCAFGYRESVFKHQFKNQFIITSVSFRLTRLNPDRSNYTFKTGYGDIKAKLDEMSVFSPTLETVSAAICAIRSSKLPDPKVLGNAGSFFKNPSIPVEQFEKIVHSYPVMPSYKNADGSVKIPAGWLIEQCGWKGKKVGHTGSHAQQALVLVNYGNATGKEIIALAQQIQKSVHEKFGIDIYPEVNFV